MTTAILKIPKPLVKSEDLIITSREDFEQLKKENQELKMAIKAIIAGEVALKKGETRNFSEFLKNKFPRYA